MSKAKKKTDQREADTRLGRDIIYFIVAVQNYLQRAGDEKALARNVGETGRKVLEQIIFETDDA